MLVAPALSKARPSAQVDIYIITKLFVQGHSDNENSLIFNENRCFEATRHGDLFQRHEEAQPLSPK
jgi:hypothetical protein